MPLRVDIASGETTLYEVDLRLPGHLPLELARVYRSKDASDGPFGYGWRFGLDLSLQVASDRVTFQQPSGRDLVFRAIPPGKQITHEESGYILQHHPNDYVVYASPVRQMVFPKTGSGRVLRLGSIVDLNGNRIKVLYQGKHLVGLIDTAGRQVHFSITNDRIGSMQVAGPTDTEAPVVLRTFRYDVHGDLVAVADALKRETRYSYQAHLMVSLTNRMGTTQYAQYDDERRCIGLWRGDLSEAYQVWFDDLRQMTKVTRADGMQAVYQHVMKDQVLSHIGPDGTAQYYYYDEQKRLMGYTNELGGIVAFQHFADGDYKHIEGKDRCVFLHYDERGLADTAADALGNEYRLAYDEQGNVTEVTTPLEAVWTFERGKQGQVTAVVSPEKRRVEIVHSRDGRTREVKDKLGLRYTDTYDPFGRLVERVDALDRRKQWTYDADGNLLSVDLGSDYQVQFAYDQEGRLLNAADNRQDQTKLTYTSFGTPQSYARTGQRSLKMQYDKYGHVIAATNKDGQTAKYAYDWKGRLLHATLFDGSTETYAYDDSGVTIEAKQNGHKAVYAYSTAMDLKNELRPDGTSRIFSFGPSGELMNAELETGTYGFTYDAEGRLEMLQKDRLVFKLAYDKDGLLVSIEDLVGERVALDYDRRGRLTEVRMGGQDACSVSYDKGDRVIQLLTPEDTAVGFGFNTIDRLQYRMLSEAGLTAEMYRFSRSAEKGLKMDLLWPMLRPEEEEGVKLCLFQFSRGLALAAQYGEFQIPLWFQDDYLSFIEADLSTRIVQAAVQGVEASMWSRPLLSGLALLERWAKDATDGFRFGYTDVPRSHDVGTYPSLLDKFFLRRVFHDFHFPQASPGFVPYHQDDPARSPDLALGGSHTIGYLKPPVGNGETVGAALRQHSSRLQGGPDPDDVLHLTLHTT